MAKQTLSSWSTSLSLIRRAKQQDPDAWERLCEIYGPLVYRWARRVGLQDADAADVGQEVFRTVARRLASFRKEQPNDTFRGWLRTITRNKLGDHMRAVRDKPQSIGGHPAQGLVGDVPEISLATDSDPAFDEDAAILHAALRLIRAEFEEPTWQAFWRTTVEEQPTDAVAEELGITREAVRQAKYRVLRRLRIELRDD